MSIRKAFDPTLYADNDRIARDRVLQQLRDNGIYARDNQDEYGVDILVHRGHPVISGIEVEVKQHWSGPTFPFDTVQLPCRKQRLLDDSDIPIEFWILNREMDHAIIIRAGVLNESQRKEIPNKYVQKGEYFWQVPINLCTILKFGTTDTDRLPSNSGGD